MRRLLILMGLMKPKQKNSFLELPRPGEPLRISRTILPPDYKNHTLEQDKQHYSPTIITN